MVQSNGRTPLTWLAELVYPPRCLVCGAILDRGAVEICPRCRAALPKLTDRVTKESGVPVCISAWSYEGELRQAILRYKFGGEQSSAPALAGLLVQALQEELPALPYAPQAVTWVPLSPKRLRQRGYDQALLLAKQVAGQLQLPLVRGLDRVRHTGRQSSMHTLAQRRENIAGAFRPRQEAGLQGLRVLLIDDILTTGATLAEAAKALKQGGVSRVVAATLAKTPRNR